MSNKPKGSGEPHNPHELEKLHRARKEFEKCAKSDFEYCANLTYKQLVRAYTIEKCAKNDAYRFILEGGYFEEFRKHREELTGKF